MAGLAGAAQAQQIHIIDMIPQVNSAETAQQSEPNLAVDPSNPSLIFATTFNNPNGGNAPVFKSTAGGAVGSWSIFQTLATSDWTINFSPAGGTCYMTRLGAGALVDKSVGGGAFTNIATLSGIGDQPHVVVGRRGGQDAVFVSGNNSTGRLYSSLNGGTTWNGPLLLETTAPAANNGPPIYNAFASTGRNYAAFTRLFNTTTGGNDSTGSLVIRRDDNVGVPTYAGLPAAGVVPPTMNNIRLPYLTTQCGIGTGSQAQRARSGLTLAVDPNNENRVAVAFPDAINGTLHLHVIQSNDGGNTWAEPFAPITGGAIPALCFAGNGAVGMVYQQWDGTNQSTHFRQSGDGFATFSDTTLTSWVGATQTNPHPYLGDYYDLESVNNTFYGIYSGSNDPSLASLNNPNITMQYDRFVQGPLGVPGTTLRASAGGAVVAASIDTFFFNVAAIPGPAGASVLALAGLFAARRRRR